MRFGQLKAAGIEVRGVTIGEVETLSGRLELWIPRLRRGL
jgi:hypothetical protein